MTQIPARCICYRQQSCEHGSWRYLNHHRQEEEGPEAPTWQAQATTARGSHNGHPMSSACGLVLSTPAFTTFLHCTLPFLFPGLAFVSYFTSDKARGASQALHRTALKGRVEKLGPFIASLTLPKPLEAWFMWAHL